MTSNVEQLLEQWRNSIKALEEANPGRMHDFMRGYYFERKDCLRELESAIQRDNEHS